MANIKEEALNYTASQLHNIAELDKISTSIDIQSETRKNKEGEDYNVRLINMDGQDYRVPSSVLEQLKIHLTDNPNIPFFKVSKQGEAMNTRYTVIPLMS